MNLIPQIAKMLGVEIGERFEIDAIDHEKGYYYYFSETELLEHRKDRTPDHAQYRILADLIYGDKKIIRLPFEPKRGDLYWRVRWDHLALEPFRVMWNDEDKDFMFKYCGNCFRTESEAKREKYNVYKRLTGKEWKE